MYTGQVNSDQDDTGERETGQRRVHCGLHCQVSKDRLPLLLLAHAYVCLSYLHTKLHIIPITCIVHQYYIISYSRLPMPLLVCCRLAVVDQDRDGLDGSRTVYDEITGI